MARIETKNYYTVAEAADKLGISKFTLDKWIFVEFDRNDILLYNGEYYIKKTAVEAFGNRIVR